MDAPPPRQKWALTQEDFDRLLEWLDHDRELAGAKYEKIRLELIRRFRCFHCVEPEDLANRAIDRVARTLPRVIAEYEGDPEPYFYAVGFNIYRENAKLPPTGPLPETELVDTGARMPDELPDDDDSQDELRDECLSRCLGRLESDDRHLILEYYRGERQEKIRRRRELAEKLGVDMPYLRVRTRRIRVRLKKCMLDCLGGKTRA